METPNRRGKAPIRHLLPPNETFSAGDGLYLIAMLAKGNTWKLQTT